MFDFSFFVSRSCYGLLPLLVLNAQGTVPLCGRMRIYIATNRGVVVEGRFAVSDAHVFFSSVVIVWKLVYCVENNLLLFGIEFVTTTARSLGAVVIDSMVDKRKKEIMSSRFAFELRRKCA